MWKNRSLPEPVSMNPKPRSVSRLTVPSDISYYSLFLSRLDAQRGRCVFS
jgi:hypothetical protein